jgi:hypothetical protein
MYFRVIGRGSCGSIGIGVTTWREANAKFHELLDDNSPYTFIYIYSVDDAGNQKERLCGYNC